MNMKKTIAAVAASAMAISAVAVPANAVVENAAATGTSFTYSLVKQYTQASTGSGAITATFQANPATETIRIAVNGSISPEGTIVISASAADSDVRFTPKSIVLNGSEKDWNLGNGYKYVTGYTDIGDANYVNYIEIAPGAFSKADVEATFTVTAQLANLTEKKKMDVTASATAGKWLYAVTSYGAALTAAQETAADAKGDEAQLAAETTAKAAVEKAADAYVATAEVEKLANEAAIAAWAVNGTDGASAADKATFEAAEKVYNEAVAKADADSDKLTAAEADMDAKEALWEAAKAGSAATEDPQVLVNIEAIEEDIEAQRLLLASANSDLYAKKRDADAKAALVGPAKTAFVDKASKDLVTLKAALAIYDAATLVDTDVKTTYDAIMADTNLLAAEKANVLAYIDLQVGAAVRAAEASVDGLAVSSPIAAAGTEFDAYELAYFNSKAATALVTGAQTSVDGYTDAIEDLEEDLAAEQAKLKGNVFDAALITSTKAAYDSAKTVYEAALATYTTSLAAVTAPDGADWIIYEKALDTYANAGGANKATFMKEAVAKYKTDEKAKYLANNQWKIDEAGLTAYVNAYQTYVASLNLNLSFAMADGWNTIITAFTAASTTTVERPYMSFVNGVNTGPYNIIEWLGTSVDAAQNNDKYSWNDVNQDGEMQASEKIWNHTDAGVFSADVQMADTEDTNGNGNKNEPAHSVNNYVNVQAVINDCVANYPNVTFTFNTATKGVVTEETLLKGKWMKPARIGTYSDWAQSDVYKNAFSQHVYNNYGSDSSTFVPFDPGAYFTNGIGYNLFTGALIINDLYTMQLTDTEMFSYSGTSLVFDYQALKDTAYASYNNSLNMIYSMKLATSVPWYWDSMTVSFAADTDDTAESDAGVGSDDEVLPDEPVDDELPAEEVETLPAETEAPAPVETEAPAPVAPAANPSTGNAPVALAVIPVALAAAAIIAKKRK
jgi:hypothetical protein